MNHLLLIAALVWGQFLYAQSHFSTTISGTPTFSIISIESDVRSEPIATHPLLTMQVQGMANWHFHPYLFLSTGIGYVQLKHQEEYLYRNGTEEDPGFSKVSSWSYLRLPLLLGCSIPLGQRWALNLQAGPQLDFLTEAYDYNARTNGQSTYLVDHTEHYNAWIPGLTFEAGTTVDLTKRLELLMVLHSSMSLDNMGEHRGPDTPWYIRSPDRIHNVAIGLRLGLTYHFIR